MFPEFLEGPMNIARVFEDRRLRSSFLPQVDDVGLLSRLPGGQPSESMDIRAAFRVGLRFDAVTLRLTVTNGELQPFRAYLGTFRNAIDQISLYTNSDIRLSLHTYPILPDNHCLFPKINELFEHLSLTNTPEGYKVKVHPSPEFTIFNVRYKKKQSFVYKSRYNIDLNQVHEFKSDDFGVNGPEMTLGPAQTEVEISDIKWTEKFDHNLPGSSTPAWNPVDIIKEVPEFVATIRSLAMLVRHKE